MHTALKGIAGAVLAALFLSLCAPSLAGDAAATGARAERMTPSGAPASALALLFGFVPALSLVYERRASNIADVFDYSRQRAELTMRRRF